MAQTVLILGCGWLGEVLAYQYRAAGCTVYATTRQQEKYHRLSADGIFAIAVDFDQEIMDSTRACFPAYVDVVINSIPASERASWTTVAQRFARISALLTSVSWTQYLYFSSVGIYPDVDAGLDETSTILDNSSLAIAERSVAQHPQAIIFRLGGLFGGQRIFAKYFQDKVCKSGFQRANFVHQQDVVALVRQALHLKLAGGIYNIVCPEHPLKKDVIEASALKYGFAHPTAYERGDDFQKIVSGEKVKKALSYTFLFPSPLDF